MSNVEEKVAEDKDAAGYSYTGGITKEEYEGILSNMLKSILETDDYQDGLFCGATSPNWEHIQTAYILHIFNHLELPRGSWFVHDQRRGVENMLDALIKCQRQDGTWGRISMTHAIH